MRSRSRSPRSSHKDRGRNGRSRSRERVERDRHGRRDRGERRERSVERLVERPRSRSRERVRERTRPAHHGEHRIREKDRERVRERERRHRRRRSHSPDDRKRSPKKNSTAGGAVPQYLLNRPEITDKDLEGKSEEEQNMMKMMGFAGFDTTKGKHVPGNDMHAVNLLQKRKYRQYMNRKGGFNRPLDFVA